jgi:2-phosphosulfolactate phosphatase
MPPEAVAGGIAVVIDVIRASTTIITALANNAAGVIPTAAIETARAQAASLGSTTLLGGERGGIRIDGFHLGNSPREYTQDRVAGHLIVFTTTNGTAALAACEPAAVAMIGSLVNRTAVATAARTAAQRHNSVVHLVCAGVERLVADEDLLGAGAIIDAAQTLFPGDQFDEPAIDARERFLAAVGHQSGAAAIETLTTSLADTNGGRRIVALGMANDLPIVAALDSHRLVPVFEPTTGLLAPHREPNNADKPA